MKKTVIAPGLTVRELNIRLPGRKRSMRWITIKVFCESGPDNRERTIHHDQIGRHA